MDSVVQLVSVTVCACSSPTFLLLVTTLCATERIISVIELFPFSFANSISNIDLTRIFPDRCNPC